MNINEIAYSLLSTIEDAFVDASIALPERRYIHSGEVAFDCDDGLLVVSSRRVFSGTPGDELLYIPRNCPWTQSVEFDIYLMRCVPVQDKQGTPPSKDRLNAAAEVDNNDILILRSAIISAFKQKILGDICDKMALFDAVGVGPQGALGGWRQIVQFGPVSYVVAGS